MEETTNETQTEQTAEHKAALKSIIDKWAQEHLDENGFVKAGQEDLAVLETQMEEAQKIALSEQIANAAIFQDQMRAKIAKETRDAIALSPRTKKTNFISPEDIAHMKDMRMQGASQMEIARKFNVSLTTIRYHLIADVADDLKERGKEYSRELLIDPAKKAAYVARQKAYAKKKYAEDPEWRKRITETNKRWLAKKKQALNVLKSNENDNENDNDTKPTEQPRPSGASIETNAEQPTEDKQGL